MPRRPTTTRRPTYPLSHAVKTKPRRWPLVLRIHKGAVHSLIIFPVLLHSIFTVLVVYLDKRVSNLGLPASIIPSLSIVVGLMLVFRNQTSYDRFWTGRNSLTTIGTSVRNLARVSLVNTLNTKGHPLTDADKADTEKVVRVLIAILYAVKHNLRAEWDVTTPNSPIASTSTSRRGSLAEALEAAKMEYISLLPDGLTGFEDQGLGLPLQLTILVETFIKRGFDKNWFHGPQASQMTVQLNALVQAYGTMEQIRTTPIPIAHKIHQKQVLALFNCILPFATVDDFGWWTVPIVAVVSFTLYGIEGIGFELEDPFGYDRNDIKMDGIIEDARREIMVLLFEWKRALGGRSNEGMFN